jgi:hypothetical protein
MTLQCIHHFIPHGYNSRTEYIYVWIIIQSHQTSRPK